MKRAYGEWIGRLEACMEQIGRDCLSALHNGMFSRRLEKTVKDIPVAWYSRQEWVDAMNYIAGTHDSQSLSAKEAKEIITRPFYNSSRAVIPAAQQKCHAYPDVS